MLKIIKNNKLSEKSIIQFSFFSALAVTIFVLENMIPKPIPFLKLGLANIVVLFLLFQKKELMATSVTFSKVFIGGFFGGTLLTPSFIMSLSGSTISIIIMLLAIKSDINFSIIGISILGAISHNVTQLFVVRYLVIKHSGIFYLTPLMIFLGLITGIVTGLVAFKLIEKRNN